MNRAEWIALLALGVAIYTAVVTTKLALGVRDAASDVDRAVGSVRNLFS